MPFPVTPAYRIRPDLTPLTGPHTVRDAFAERYAEAKQLLLAQVPERCRVLAADADSAGVAEALRRFARIAAADRGAVDELDRAEDRPAEPFTRDRVLALADEVALSVQEDIVVMRVGVGAELLHVCFPSHWDPGAHAGSPLEALHGPVPHGARLRVASENLLKAMIEKGPFERWVWSVNTAGTLHGHPAEDRPEPETGALIPQLFFRVERQTTIPLPDLGRSVFTIRIFQAELGQVLAVEPGRAALLATAIGSMDPELRAYKGLRGIADGLVTELASFHPAAFTPEARSSP